MIARSSPRNGCLRVLWRNKCCCHRAETSAHEREEEQRPFANASVALRGGPLVPPEEEEGYDIENGIEAKSRGDECHDGLYNPNPARLAFRIAKKEGLCP